MVIRNITVPEFSENERPYGVGQDICQIAHDALVKKYTRSTSAGAVRLNPNIFFAMRFLLKIRNAEYKKILHRVQKEKNVHVEVRLEPNWGRAKHHKTGNDVFMEVFISKNRDENMLIAVKVNQNLIENTAHADWQVSVILNHYKYELSGATIICPLWE